MFSKLRNKFVLTTVGVSSLIIVFAFSLVYGVAAYEQSNNAFVVPNEINSSIEMRRVFMRGAEQARDEHLGRLALVLVIVGVLTEVLVFIVSYYFAEQSIKPVREAYEKQKDFIANASHELKTPIAAAQANFEALGTDEQPWTGNVEMELDRASKLVGDLLLLARTDGRSAEAEKKEVDAVKLVRKHAQLIEARLGEKKLELDVPKTLRLKLVVADFEQVLDILLDNAVKYSKTRIVVKITTKSLSVENDGQTIAPDQLEQIFERFYQTDKTAQGSGLGLAIAKSLAEQNNWKIVAQSEKGLTRFTLGF